jgi:hypothetical protein
VVEKEKNICERDALHYYLVNGVIETYPRFTSSPLSAMISRFVISSDMYPIVIPANHPPANTRNTQMNNWRVNEVGEMGGCGLCEDCDELDGSVCV